VSSGSDRPNIPSYDVAGDWADLAAVPGAASCWVHNAVVATDGGELIGFHAGQLVAFDSEGRLLRAVETDLTEGHGVTLVREGDEECLWVCDPGFVFSCGADDGDPNWTPLFGKGVHCETRAPRVVKMALDGQIRSELPTPPQEPAIPAGPMGPYCPCGCVVDEERYGGSGRFLCPHAIFIDRRNDKVPELYIADRINVRVLVYDLEGRYLRTFGETFLSSPSDFARGGDLLVVAEIYERLAVLDSDDSLVGYIGADPEPKAAQG
jgi:hypothetical protein